MSGMQNEARLPGWRARQTIMAIQRRLAETILRASYKTWDDRGYVCHFYLTDGVLNFLNDCSHEARGKTIPLPDIPESDL